MKFQFSLRWLVIGFPLLFAIGWASNLIDGYGQKFDGYWYFNARLWRITAAIDSSPSLSFKWAKSWVYLKNGGHNVVDMQETTIGWPSRNLYPRNCTLVRVSRYNPNQGTPERPCGSLFIDIVLP